MTAHPCAAVFLAALRVVFDHPGYRGEPAGAPPLSVLRDEIDEAIALLAAGLGRPADETGTT